LKIKHTFVLQDVAGNGKPIQTGSIAKFHYQKVMRMYCKPSTIYGDSTDLTQNMLDYIRLHIFIPNDFIIFYNILHICIYIDIPHRII
jgi:hypothetical protein